MESAVVLDGLIGEGGEFPDIAARYTAAWKPEADAVSWISQQTLFENPANTLRSVATMAIGQNVVDQAKSSDRSYSEVREKARRLGPVWTATAS
jgi:kynurenine 3-monooxygenase